VQVLGGVEGGVTHPVTQTQQQQLQQGDAIRGPLHTILSQWP
jgi:hypothetical protein